MIELINEKQYLVHIKYQGTDEIAVRTWYEDRPEVKGMSGIKYPFRQKGFYKRDVSYRPTENVVGYGELPTAWEFNNVCNIINENHKDNVGKRYLVFRENPEEHYTIKKLIQAQFYKLYKKNADLTDANGISEEFLLNNFVWCPYSEVRI